MLDSIFNNSELLGFAAAFLTTTAFIHKLFKYGRVNQQQACL